jgi:hypothetical protein
MKVHLGQLAANIAAMAVVFGLTLFVPAGTLAWPGAWTYLVLLFGFTVGLSIWLLRFNPDLQALQKELDGYSAYMTRVRYRFVPHVW